MKKLLLSAFAVLLGFGTSVSAVPVGTIQLRETLQTGATFYTSSGTANTFNMTTGKVKTSITWPDGTVQVSSPSASGGASSNLASTQTWTGQNNWTTPAQSTFTYGVTAGSLTINGTGNLKFVNSGDANTYQVVGSSTIPTNGHFAVWASSIGLIDGGTGGGSGTPSTPLNSVQFNNAGAFGGSALFQFNGTSVTVVSSTTFKSAYSGSGNTDNTTPGFVNIFDGTQPPAGKPLFTLGSNSLVDQIIFPNQAPVNMATYGADLGCVYIGEAANSNLIYSCQSANNFIDMYTGDSVTGEMAFQTGAAVTRDMVFKPETVETLRLSSQTVTAQSSMTVVGSLSIRKVPYTWPTGVSAGGVFSVNTSSVIAITAAGAGDMILASTQVVTGAKTFLSSTSFSGTVPYISGSTISFSSATFATLSNTALSNGFCVKTGAGGAEQDIACPDHYLTTNNVWAGTNTYNGNVNFSSGVFVNGTTGTSGQVMTSGGAGTIPSWSTLTSAGLASTQIWTGGNTFQSSTTHNGTVIVSTSINASGTGTSGQFLTSGGQGAVSWTTGNVGTITSVIAGTGMTGGGASGAVTLTAGTTTMYTSSTQTITAQHTFSNSVIISTTIALTSLSGVGTNGQVLTSGGAAAAPTWTTPAVGTITGITGGTGLSGGGTSGAVTLSIVSTAAFTTSTQTWSAQQTLSNTVIISTTIGLTNLAGVGTAGQVMTSGGAAAVPTWSTLTGAALSSTQTFSGGNTFSSPSGLAVTYNVAAASAAFTTSLTLPNGANPTVDAVGKIAMDTTDGILVGYDGTSAKVLGFSTHSVTVSISSGTGWNSLSIPVWRAPVEMAVTITQINAESLPASTTVLYQLDERAFGSINTAGSSLFSVAYSTANGTGVTTTSLGDNSIAANASLVMTTPAAASSGTPTVMTFTIYYTRNRE